VPAAGVGVAVVVVVVVGVEVAVGVGVAVAVGVGVAVGVAVAVGVIGRARPEIDPERLKSGPPRYSLPRTPMLRNAIATAAAIGLSAGACGLDSSGLLSAGGQSGSSSGVGGLGGVGVGADATAPVADSGGGGSAIADGGGGGSAMGDAGTSDVGAGGGPLGEAAAGSAADVSVPIPASSGSMSPPDSGGPASDGATSADTGGAVLACGNQLLCAVPGQTCCVAPSGMGGGPGMLTCENRATCSDPNATALHCTAAADCAAPQVCCLSQQSSPATSQCSPQCGNGDVQLCDPSAQNTGCAGRAMCVPPGGRGGHGPLPNGVGTCG
jgi:hypothetical protein